MNISTRMVRTLSAPAVAVALIAMGAPTALADTSVSALPLTFSNPGDGLTAVLPDAEGVRHTAGTYILDADNNNVVAYDVNFPVPTNYQDQFTPASWSSANVSDIAKAVDLVQRHNDIGTPYADPRWEAAAVQVAVWTLTSEVSAEDTGNTAFAQRVQALVDGSSAAAEPQFARSYEVSTEATDYGTVLVKVRVSDSQGPVPSTPVRVVVEDTDLTAFTSDSGYATVDVPKRLAGKQARVMSTARVPAGVFLQASTGASLITASAAPVTTFTTVDLPGPDAVDAAVNAGSDAGSEAVADPALAGTDPTVENSPAGSASGGSSSAASGKSPGKVSALNSSLAADPATEGASQAVPGANSDPSAQDSSATGKQAKGPKELPETGSSIPPAALFALLGLALVATGIFVQARKA